MRKFSSFLLICTLVMMTASFAFAQQGAVLKGKVIDENGEALVGASVFIDAQELGAVKSYGNATDINGDFSFPVPARYANGQEVTLKAMYVGYKLNEAKVSLRTGTITQDFTLEVDVFNLDEVLVTGVISDTPRKKLAFTVAKVDQEEIQMAPAVNMATAMSGKVAGVKVKASSGRPGDGVEILLRGATSIQGNNSPLVIVDNVITTTDVRDLDALDIADIQIVKGAAAASLYGSRASNGVISITTNRGRSLGLNQTKVTVRSEYGFSALAPFNNPVIEHHGYAMNAGGTGWLDSAGDPTTVYANAAHDATDAGSYDRPGISGKPELYAVFDNDYFETTWNNVDRFFANGAFSSNSVTVGQNLGATNWRASFGSSAQAGLIDLLDGNARKNARINLDHEIREGLTMSLSGAYTQSENDRPDGDNPFYGMMFMSPNVDLLADNEDGTPYNVDADDRSNEQNPLYGVANSDRMQNRNRAMGSLNIRYQPVTWFNVEGNMSYDRSQRSSDTFRAKGLMNEEGESGSRSPGDFMYFNAVDQALNSSITASLNRSFGDFSTRFKVRYLNEATDYEDWNMSGSGLLVANLRDMDAIEQQESKRVNSSTQEVVSNGFFFMTGIDYKDKYITDFLLRWDGSSLFGPDERWNQYYRAAFAYRLSEEDWFNFESVNEFKLRYSIGTAGNRPRFADQYETYRLRNGSMDKDRLGNNALKPELSTEQEMGADFSLFNKFNFELSYSNTEAKDQILEIPLKSLMGFSSRMENAGTMETKTFEASVNYSIVSTRDFNWSARFLMDRTRQKITEFGRSELRFSGGTGTNAFKLREGEDFGTMYTWAFMNSLDDLPANAAGHENEFAVNDDGLLVWVGAGNSYTDGHNGAKALWGTVSPETLVDHAGNQYNWGRPILNVNTVDGVEDAFFNVGRATPDWSWSFSNNFRWKGLTAFVLFDAQMGGIIYNQTKSWPYREERHNDVDQAGKAEGLKKPVVYYRDLYATNNVTDFFQEDGTFVKLREVALKYSFNQNQIVNAFGDSFGSWLDRLTVGVIGRNLLTFSDYSGFDPEVAGGNIFKVDSFDYPPSRTFTGYIEIEF